MDYVDRWTNIELGSLQNWCLAGSLKIYILSGIAFTSVPDLRLTFTAWSLGFKELKM